jgi:23S rRNA pseudouridine1911/1915/1917 synthase
MADTGDGGDDDVPDDTDYLTGSFHFVVEEASAGRRLDVALAELSGESRAQVQRWIESGVVLIAGVPQTRPSRKLIVGDSIDATPHRPVEATIGPEAIALDVLYEDEHLIVIAKPSGLVVHPAPGNWSGTLVNALMHHCDDLSGIGGVLRPGIVHRLDGGTSGVIVAAKNDHAHIGLSRQFEDHSIERMYMALVRAAPKADSGRVDRAIGRHPRDRKRMSVRTRAGRSAVTEWRVRERFKRAGAAFLEIRPRTGRTHQIRVHLASIGMPLLGDDVYGRAHRDRARHLPRIEHPALHAALLGFIHPATGARLRFEAPLPADLLAALEALRESEIAV